MIESVQQVNKVVLLTFAALSVVVSSYIVCVLLLFTCRGELHIGKTTKIFVQKLLHMIGCKNGRLRNLNCLCTALLVQKVSVSEAVCEFGHSYLLPNGLK